MRPARSLDELTTFAPGETPSSSHPRPSRIARAAIALILCAIAFFPAPLSSGAGAAPADNAGVNILLLGSDARPGEQIDATRSDIIMILHFNPKTGSCGLLSVPRDSRVEVPGVGMTKINHALMMGGIPLSRETVSNYLGIPIDHYVLVDFVSARMGIDALGGITVQNDYDFTVGKEHFPVGPVQLDGARAVTFARFRGGPDGDFGRIRRQHLVFAAAMQKARGAALAPLVTKSWTAFAGHYETDLTAKQVIDLATRYRATCTPDTIRMLTINGGIADYVDPIFNVSLSYVVSDPAEVQQKVAELLAS